MADKRAKMRSLRRTARDFMVWLNALKKRAEKKDPHAMLSEEEWGKIWVDPANPEFTHSYHQLLALKKDIAQLMEQMHHIDVTRKRHELVAAQARGELSRENVMAALEADHLNEAQIVFCTLSTAGSQIMMRYLRRRWDLVLIDEAAQSVELSTLVALQHQVSRCILIGDPQQLPATVQINSAAARLYQQSLFERLARAGHKVVMLSTQYRMHPAISSFPSRHFYQGRLQDGPNVAAPAWQRPFHQERRFQPLLFYDVTAETRSKTGSRSSYNPAEAQFVVTLLKQFVENWAPTGSNAPQKLSVGVITPYAAQRAHLDRLLKEAMVEAKRQDRASNGWDGVTLKVATVDGFQGGEKDVIVFSCVRAGGRRGIGFLADIRRMNVGLTRARHACWVVGDSRALVTNVHWKAFLDHCKTNGCYVAPEKIKAVSLGML
mmetsp:Transcript_24250/g.47353  ORF Transcript_24250/g.47353 Transcript_24250/m.47353 type:complete len:434 (+) Transcript_24250:85-1386(+)